jgi:raffinose/stachyose/melibiose transport system permease protein
MKNKAYPLYFIALPLIIYLMFTIIPAILGIGLSFTDWNRFTSEINYVGLDNFFTIFLGDGNYLSYISNTLYFTVTTIVLKTIIALILALLLHHGVKKLVSLHRALVFLPAILPMVVIGILFKSILHPRNGLLNEFLKLIGLDALAMFWLGDPAIALTSVIGVDTWKGVGYIMVILLAGLQIIPTEYYEAAEIDGANGFKKLIYITLPLLMPAIIVITVLNMLHGLRVFDIVFVLTNGGPGYSTEVLFTSIFKEFSKGRYGLGTALNSVMFIFMTICGYFVIRLMERGRSSE